MQGREEAKHGCGQRLWRARFVDAAYRQGMYAETAIAGPRVGLLRLLTKAAAVGAVPGCRARNAPVRRRRPMRHSWNRSADARWDRGRRPPESPVAAPISFG